MTTDEQRIGYLAADDGASGEAIDPDERAALDAVRALLADATTWEEPPPGLGAGVVSAIAAERASGAPRATPSGARSIAAATSRSASAARSRSRRGRGALTFLAGAIAAAVVAAGLLVVSHRSTGGVQVALAGTELAPSASGSARVTKKESGLRIDLNATGLPRRDGLLFYQAWLKGNGGLVPIGTFHTGEHVVLWAGVALEDFPTITVTQQQVGDTASSGKRVLVGTVTT